MVRTYRFQRRRPRARDRDDGAAGDDAQVAQEYPFALVLEGRELGVHALDHAHGDIVHVVEDAKVGRDGVAAHEILQTRKEAVPEMGPRGLVAVPDPGEQAERGSEARFALEPGIVVLVIGFVAQRAPLLARRRTCGRWSSAA